jgi:hypothetical protein
MENLHAVVLADSARKRKRKQVLAATFFESFVCVES